MSEEPGPGLMLIPELSSLPSVHRAIVSVLGDADYEILLTDPPIPGDVGFHIRLPPRIV